MLQIMNARLQLAKNRKGCMIMEKRVKNMHDRIDHCKKHSEYKEKVLLKNIKLYQEYEEQQRKNIEVWYNFYNMSLENKKLKPFVIIYSPFQKGA